MLPARPIWGRPSWRTVEVLLQTLAVARSGGTWYRRWVVHMASRQYHDLPAVHALIRRPGVSGGTTRAGRRPPRHEHDRPIWSSARIRDDPPGTECLREDMPALPIDT